MRLTIEVGDTVTLFAQMNRISGCRVLELKDDQALIEKPREDEWVPVSHLSIDRDSQRGE